MVLMGPENGITHNLLWGNSHSFIQDGLPHVCCFCDNSKHEGDCLAYVARPIKTLTVSQ